MSRRREPLRLGSHWHVDCRIEAELPEDNLVSPHFIAHVLFGSLALVMVLFTGWIGYKVFSVRAQIREWEKTIANNSIEVRELQRMQREYVAEAAKIDQTYGAIRPTLFVSEFIAGIARTLPRQLGVDVIEWGENSIIIRGTLRESGQRATRVMADYITMLNNNGKIGPHFREIRLLNLDRVKGANEVMNFEIVFRLQPPPPL